MAGLLFFKAEVVGREWKEADTATGLTVMKKCISNIK